MLGLNQIEGVGVQWNSRSLLQIEQKAACIASQSLESKPSFYPSDLIDTPPGIELPKHLVDLIVSNRQEQQAIQIQSKLLKTADAILGIIVDTKT